jgi:cellulose synthase/poly-beta-1,6-N-acetylglucosamine synthase-like glycosyltransferase
MRFLARNNFTEEDVRVLPGDDDCPAVTVLIVAHNEQQAIERKVRDCLDQDYPASKLRVMVVSDGSTDDTVKLVQAIDSSRAIVIDRAERKGKAACINAGMAEINDGIVVLADTRQRLSERAVRSLVAQLSDPATGVAAGELAFEGDDAEWFARGINAYWQRETQLRKDEAILHSVIGVSGALYAIKREAFEPVPEATILDDVLIPMNAVMRGFKVKFCAAAKAYDKPSTDVANEQRRKIRTLAGNFQLVGLRPNLLNPLRNPVAMQFVSHKMLRLIAPLAMLVVLVASVYLASTHWMFALFALAQVFAYFLAIVPESFLGFTRIKLFRLIRTFVLMHWFVILGFFEFLSNRHAHLWHSNAKGESEPA